MEHESGPGYVDIRPDQARSRYFETGATRDTDEGKLDYEGFISPLVTKRYAEYMHVHRKQSDGGLRDADNWQKGIPKEAYVKSLVRHMQDFKLHWDGFPEEAVDKDFDSVICACLFNLQGLLFERLKENYSTKNRIYTGAKANEVPIPW